MRDGVDGGRNEQASERGGGAISDIAIIDDDRALLEVTLLAVREAGFSAVGFHEPLDALMWASDADPTCIVADLKMPGVEGLDLVAAFCALIPSRGDHRQRLRGRADDGRRHASGRGRCPAQAGDGR
ncbi:response regulator FixJ [compost metagenome]|uniref:response regulator n=1 Tax=Brevundimonas diminuta TaxID=293 RepID=UPI000FB39207